MDSVVLKNCRVKKKNVIKENQNIVCLCTQVRMVTGDNLQTAKAIALECGILTSHLDAVEPVIIEGKTFRALSEKEREEVAKKITVRLSLSNFCYVHYLKIFIKE